MLLNDEIVLLVTKSYRLTFLQHSWIHLTLSCPGSFCFVGTIHASAMIYFGGSHLREHVPNFVAGIEIPEPYGTKFTKLFFGESSINFEKNLEHNFIFIFRGI